MPAPTGALLKAEIELKMGSTTSQSPHFQKFIKALTDEISLKWSKWILSMSWGGNTVVGAGLGAWAGVGNGGTLTASPYKFSAQKVFTSAGFTVQTPASLKFLETLDKTMGKQFDAWVLSYKTNGDAYIGTSSASPVSPGVFSAVNTPTSLIALGKGKEPSMIQKDWEVLLESSPDPVFNLNNEFCYTRLFTSAVSSTIEKKFITEFLTNSNGVGDSVVGPSAPGSGSGAMQSIGTGKVI